MPGKVDRDNPAVAPTGEGSAEEEPLSQVSGRRGRSPRGVSHLLRNDQGELRGGAAHPTEGH